MAIRIVDEFQPIHIHGKQRQGKILRFSKLQAAFQFPQKSAAVVQPGQVIVLSHAENRIVRLFQPSVAYDGVQRGGKKQRLFFKTFRLPQAPCVHAGDEKPHGFLLVLQQLRHYNANGRIEAQFFEIGQERPLPAEGLPGREAAVYAVKDRSGAVRIVFVQHRGKVIRVFPHGKQRGEKGAQLFY